MAFDNDVRVVRRMLHRIGDDIGEQLVQAVLVGFDVQLVRHVDLHAVVVAAVGDFQRFRRPLEELLEVETGDLQAGGAGFHARQVEEEGDEVGEPVRFRDDHLEVGGSGFHDVIGHVLGEGLHSGDGGTQLVADVGDEVLAHLVGVLQLFGHGVEAGGELRDLVGAGDGHAGVVGAGGHGFRRVAHLQERSDEVPGEYVADDERQQQDDWQGDPSADA